jgi:hypothetical protein
LVTPPGKKGEEEKEGIERRRRENNTFSGHYICLSARPQCHPGRERLIDLLKKMSNRVVVTIPSEPSVRQGEGSQLERKCGKF